MSRTFRRKQGFCGSSRIDEFNQITDHRHAEANELYRCWRGERHVQPYLPQDIRKQAKQYTDCGYKQRIGEYSISWDAMRAKYRDRLTEVVKCTDIEDIEMIDVIQWERYHYHDYD